MRCSNFIHSRIQRYSLYGLWGCLLAIVLLSLLPGHIRPHTGAPGEFEHFIAYFGAGLFISIRYQLLRLRLIFWAVTAILSFILEILQQFVPGRGSGLYDALASSSGLTVGILLAAALTARGWRDVIDWAMPILKHTPRLLCGVAVLDDRLGPPAIGGRNLIEIPALMRLTRMRSKWREPLE
jgi:VanZ family protein